MTLPVWLKSVVTYGAVTGVAVLALVSAWYKAVLTVPNLDREPRETLVVENSRDNGEGSLREAIRRANEAPHRVRIVCRARAIELETPLPSVANAFGTVIEADDGRCLLQAENLDARPVVEILAPESSVSRIAVSGAVGAGILVRAENVLIEGVTFRGGNVGLLVADKGSGLTVRASEFAGNNVGVELTGEQHGVRITGNRFREQRKAGVWAVHGQAPARRSIVARISDNRFEDVGHGVVAINVPVEVTGNEIRRAETAGMHLSGPGLSVSLNRLHLYDAATGIFTENLESTRIAQNDIRGGGVGIQLRNAADCLVQENRMYRSEYGLIVLHGPKHRPVLILDNHVAGHRADGLYVLGASPVIRGNALRDNRHAGVRLVDFINPAGRRETSNPMVDANEMAGNDVNIPLRAQLSATGRP